MRLPDPIANTTTEAYLAYKAGVLEEGDLKPKLYEPYIHLDAWLAYWTGLTKNYPVKGVGKNLFDKDKALDNYFYTSTGSKSTYREPQFYNNKFYPKSNKITMSFSAAHDRQSGSNIEANVRIVQYDASGNFISRLMSRTNGYTFTLDANTKSFILCVDNGSDAWFDDLQVEYGSTATSYEPYTGEPEMLTDEEAYIAYLSGVTDTYPEEFRDPADIRVAAYLRYLISARWGRPEYPVTNEEFYLSLQNAPYIPSGDPSSDIVIDGTAKAPFQDVKMYGDTFQQSYEGKNLLKLTQQSSTSNGITATLSNGVISYSGTATKNWANLTSRTTNSISAGEYTFSMKEDFASGYAFCLNVTYTDNTMETFEIWRYTGKKKVITFSKDVASYFTFIAGLVSGTTYSDTMSLMLESGTTDATSFEPYVGGVPSPNPDYPQPIQTVTGLQTVEIVGKNLYNPARAFASGVNLQNIRLKISIESGQTYTFNATDDRPYAAVRLFDSNNSQVRSIGNLPSSHLISFTAQVGEVAAFLDFYSGGTNVDVATYDFSGVQLEVGSTATAYAPYSEQTLPLDLGTIELCKLGTCQDYIYKDGDDWKVHKATAIASASNREWEWINISPNGWYFSRTNYGYYDINKINVISKSFIGVKRSVAPNTSGAFITMAGDGSIGIRNPNMTGSSNVTQFTNWLNSLNTTWLYALTTPTDTTITDQTLIAQLEALVAGGAENGTTYIKVSATDPNLPGLLYVEAPKYD